MPTIDIIRDTELSEKTLTGLEDLRGYSDLDVERITDKCTKTIKLPSGSVGECEYAVIEPAGGERDDSVIGALELSYGQRINPVNVFRGIREQRLLGSGNHRVLVFSRERMDWANLNRIRQGDFTPLIDQQYRILGKERALESPLFVSGYSKGAAVALALALAEVNVPWLSIAEPPTGVERTDKEIKEAFGGDEAPLEALRTLNRAIIGSDLETLRILQGVSKRGKTTPQQLAGMGMFGAYAMTPSGRASRDMLRRATFLTSLQRLVKNKPETKLAIGRAQKSLIFPKGVFIEALQLSPDAYAAEFEGYGHEAADNFKVAGEFSVRSQVAFNL